MEKKKASPKPKNKLSKRQPKEDFNQATFRVMQEVTRRSETASSLPKS